MGDARYAWANPVLEEVAAGIYRYPLPLPGDALRAVNVYLLASHGGYLLVDCGWDGQAYRQELAGVLRRLGSDLRAVRAIFATHAHRDHLGLAFRIRQESGAWVQLGRGEQQTVDAFAADPRQARQASLERLLRCGADDVVVRLREQEPDQQPWRPGQPDLYLTGGELIRHGLDSWEVLATPGHTRGHLCLFEKTRGILFAGDHVLPQITPSLGVELPAPLGRENPLAAFLQSLEQVRDLPAQLVLPAHGPTFSDLSGRVDELLEHHRVRLNDCREALPPGGGTARQVAGALGWTRRRRPFSDLDPFNQMLAVTEVDAHLEVLVWRGLLRRREGRATTYRRVDSAGATMAETDLSGGGPE